MVHVERTVGLDKAIDTEVGICVVKQLGLVTIDGAHSFFLRSCLGTFFIKQE